jgi:ribosomal protein S18 acetylase RimI-like enzyme
VVGEYGVVAEHIEIRWATVADDAALVELDRTSFSPESGFPSITGRAPFFGERSRPEDLLIAEHESRLVGYLRLKNKYPFAEGAGVFAVMGLAVAPDARRLGVASALLEEAIDEARRRGGRKLVLNVLGTNAAAQRLYERHGFVVEGRGLEEFQIEGNLVDDLIMAKKL